MNTPSRLYIENLGTSKISPLLGPTGGDAQIQHRWWSGLSRWCWWALGVMGVGLEDTGLMQGLPVCTHTLGPQLCAARPPESYVLGLYYAHRPLLEPPHPAPSHKVHLLSRSYKRKQVMQSQRMGLSLTGFVNWARRLCFRSPSFSVYKMEPLSLEGYCKRCRRMSTQGHHMQLSRLPPAPGWLGGESGLHQHTDCHPAGLPHWGIFF